MSAWRIKMISRDSHPLKSIFQRGRFLSKCLADFFYKPTSLPHVFLKLYTMSNKFWHAPQKFCVQLLGCMSDMSDRGICMLESMELVYFGTKEKIRLFFGGAAYVRFSKMRLRFTFAIIKHNFDILPIQYMETCMLYIL